jgi:predicted flap endonuclease-1-like 5' DNA nuclease
MYLFFQTWGWVVGAFLLGILLGWWICGRCNCGSKDKATNKSNDKDKANPKESSSKVVVATANKIATSAEDVDVESGWQPKGLKSKPKDADDLKRIKGIGPVIEKTLHGLGMYHFKQIAEFNAENIAWVDKHISFPGRIEREQWVSQAKKLAAEK